MSAVVVLAAGNDARGDDALGPRLLDYVDALALPSVRTVFDFQFQIEHALELDDAELALFIDAHAMQRVPLRLRRVVADVSPFTTSHALSPAQVLAVHGRVGRHACPPAFVLSVAGTCLELGAGLSATAAIALAVAQTQIAALLADPRATAWARAADQA